MCNITISTIHGVVCSPATNPAQLQITGTLSGCAANNVTVTVTDSSGIIVAGPGSATSVNVVTGRWVSLLTITAGNVACGSPLTVDAECATDSTCKATLSVMGLPCCDIHLVSLAGVVFPGTLEPGALNVIGTAFGCCGGQVTVAVTDSTGLSIAGPATLSADAITGQFSGTLTVTGSVQCDDAVTVDISCAQNPACARTFKRFRVNCPDCTLRAQVSYTAGACTGNPPAQPVTLSATICIPAGAIDCFRWDYGDGAHGAVFTIDNSNTSTVPPDTANTQHQHVEPAHSYLPGTYTATLHLINCASGALEECAAIPLTVAVSCCPIIVTITSTTVGPCTGNGTENVTINFSVSGLPSGWLATLAVLINNVQQPTFTAGNGSSSVTIQVPALTATSYAIGLRTVSPTGCPDIVKKVAISACPCCVPTPNLKCTVAGCAPAAVVTFGLDATTPWTWPAGCTQQQPQITGFDLEISSAGVTLFRRTVASLPVSSQDNAWLDLATGTTGPMAFTASGGTFSVGAVAHLSGLTCTSSQGSVNFQVTPCCPQLNGLTGVVSSSDPCTVNFTAAVTGSAPGATFTWLFSDGGSTTTSGPSVSHTFPPSTTMAGATVTLSVPTCVDQHTSTQVALTGCTCPTVGVPAATVTGCIGTGSTASVSLSTTVTPPAAGASFKWTVTPPSGTPFTKTTSGTTTTDGTADGPWTNTSTGSTGALDVTGAGAYAVAVTASGPTIPASCAAPAPKGFSIPTCGGGGGSTTNWGCVALRWIAAFLFIVAGFSWILYFCMGPILGATPYTSWVPWVLLGIAITATVAAIVLLLLWALLPICPGKPCAWGLLLWWQVSIGFGVTTLYFINCCGWTLAVGLISLAIGIIVLIWWWVKCKRTACDVAIEMAPVLAAVIALIGYAALLIPQCINGVVGAIVGTVSAALTIALAVCASSGTKPSGN